MVKVIPRVTSAITASVMLANFFQRRDILGVITSLLDLRQKSFYDRLLRPVNGCLDWMKLYARCRAKSGNQKRLD